jgi:hypothetical protein
MPLAGMLTTRLGCRRVIDITTLCIFASLIGLATTSSATLLALALFFFGAGIGGIDVAMNVQAVIVAEDSGRPLMSGFHGMFSAGGIAGASGASLLLWIGASTGGTSICIGLVIVVWLLICWRHLLSCESVDESSTFVFPRGAVLFVGILCFISFLTEGSPASIASWPANATIVRFLDKRGEVRVSFCESHARVPLLARRKGLSLLPPFFCAFAIRRRVPGAKHVTS